MTRPFQFIDATRKPSHAAMRAARRRLLGMADRASRSTDPTATWRQDMPALAAAADKAQRELLIAELHRHGRDPGAEWLDAHLQDRATAVQYAAATMSPATAAQILARAGVELRRAVKLVMAVGPSVADAIAWLSVVDLIAIDDAGERGAA